MKKAGSVFASFFLALFSYGLILPARGGAQVRVETGRVSLNGEVQFVFDMIPEDRDNNQPRVEDFQVRYPRFALSGELGRYAGFYLRGELDSSTSDIPILLDAKIDLKPLSFLTVSAGRFLPAWTLYLPADIRNLETLRYPLMVDPQTATFNPGRQTGADLVFHFGGSVDLHAGVFNGLNRPNNFDDNDDKKDYLISLEARLREHSRLVAGYYAGDFHVDEMTLAPGESVTLPSGQTITNTTNNPLSVGGNNVHHASVDFGLAGNLAQDRVRVRAEYLHHQSESQGSTLVKSLGYLLHLGVVPIRRIELLGRYEYLDPDTGTARNELAWTTVGLNLGINDHARASVNYIFKYESGVEVSQGGNRAHNDELLAGITLWW